MRCCARCRGQHDRDFEVLVADDGSGPATAALIEQWKPRLGVPLTHVRHEHRGFRAGEIRNRALLAARGDYRGVPRRRLPGAAGFRRRRTGGWPSPAGSSPATGRCCRRR